QRELTLVLYQYQEISIVVELTISCIIDATSSRGYSAKIERSCLISAGKVKSMIEGLHDPEGNFDDTCQPFAAGKLYRKCKYGIWS
ncbi:MAG: hypothetical protein WCA08_17420, partial [Desulfoferrobacter sp.]